MLKKYPVAAIPTVQMKTKSARRRGLTAFLSMTSDGSDNVVTAIMKARTVPSWAPLPSRASAPEGVDGLGLGAGEAFPRRRDGRIDVDALNGKDEVFDVLFHSKLLDERAARDRDDQPENHVRERDLPAENAEEKHQATEIDHRRGDEKGEGDADRQPGAREADEERNRRAGAKGRHGSEQRRDEVRSDAAEAAENALAPLGREIALHVRDPKNQDAEEHRDLEDVVDEEVRRRTPARGGVDADG